MKKEELFSYVKSHSVHVGQILTLHKFFLQLESLRDNLMGSLLLTGMYPKPNDISVLNEGILIVKT